MCLTLAFLGQIRAKDENLRFSTIIYSFYSIPVSSLSVDFYASHSSAEDFSSKLS